MSENYVAWSYPIRHRQMVVGDTVLIMNGPNYRKQAIVRSIRKPDAAGAVKVVLRVIETGRPALCYRPYLQIVETPSAGDEREGADA